MGRLYTPAARAATAIRRILRLCGPLLIAVAVGENWLIVFRLGELLMTLTAKALNSGNTADQAAPPVTTSPPEECWTVKQVMAYLQVSSALLHSLRQTTDFPKPVMLGSQSPRWLKSAIDAWLTANAGR